MTAKNKIIVTGLALAADADPKVCQTCNFDISWVFDYPSTLLWADSIIVSPSILKTIKRGDWPKPKMACGYPVADVLKAFFDQAGENGLLEEQDPAKHIDEGLRVSLRTQVETDRRKLGELFPATVSLDAEENVPGSMAIEGEHYCTPRILSIYYSLLLADIWGAQLLLNDHCFTFLKYSFGTRVTRVPEATQSLTTFRELFREQLPEIDIRPYTGERSCWGCNKFTTCDETQLRKIEARIKDYIKLRDYDELAQMKQVHARLAARIKGTDTGDFAGEMKRAFEDTQRKLNRRLHKSFPVAARWSNLTTILSIPVVVAGTTTGSATIAVIGAGIAGLSQIAKQYIGILASKNRWVCFRQGCDNGHSEMVKRGSAQQGKSSARGKPRR